MCVTLRFFFLFLICCLATLWHLAELRLIVMHPVVQSVCGLHLVLSYVSYSTPPPTRGSAFRKGGKIKTQTHAHTIDCISSVKKTVEYLHSGICIRFWMQLLWNHLKRLRWAEQQEAAGELQRNCNLRLSQIKWWGVSANKGGRDMSIIYLDDEGHFAKLRSRAFCIFIRAPTELEIWIASKWEDRKWVKWGRK